MSYDNVTPQVAAFLQSFPKRSDRPSDKDYPNYRKMHCFQCGFDTAHYLSGIAINKKNAKDKTKWPVLYECDMCKDIRCFKYFPGKNPKFISMKFRISGITSVYHAPRNYPLFNYFMQTRSFVYDIVKSLKRDPPLS